MTASKIQLSPMVYIFARERWVYDCIATPICKQAPIFKNENKLMVSRVAK